MAPVTDAEEAVSVVSWFEFYTHLYENGARVARPSRTLLQLLQSAFPTLYEVVAARRLTLGTDEWACVFILLEAFYEVELGIDRSTLHDAMTFEDASLHLSYVDTLKYVVGALVQSESKARFVGDIMAMEDSVQVHMMAVIDRVMKHTASLVSNRASGQEESDRAGDDHNSTEHGSEVHQLMTPTRSSTGQTSSSSPPAFMASRSPLHLATNAEMERLQRANNILKEDSIYVAKEVENLKAKLDRAETENASLLETIESIKVQAEMDVLKKERTVRSFFDERVHSLQRELDRLRGELEEKTAVAREVSELRDEIDLLRPSADKLMRAEATLAKYKSKIEDLASVNERFRRTEEANTELVEKNLALEKQAAKATMLQRKLADSKEANTTIQFHFSELESKLTRLATELEAKRLECDSMSAALLEAKSLNNQLQQTVDQQIDMKGGFTPSGTGSAGGISELNPELMEKIARLEHENATLRSQVDGTTSDRIDALLDDIDDLKRMKNSFETKYFDTNDLLKETRSMLANAEETASKLREELDNRTQDLHTTTANRDKMILAVKGAEQRIRELTDVDAAKGVEIHRRIELEQSLDAEISQRGEEILSLQSTLRQTVQQLRLSSERNDRLSEDISAHQWARRDLVVHRDELLDKIQSLDVQCSSQSGSITELESEREGLRDQLDDAKYTISSLRENEGQLAMRCEELDSILIANAARIDAQTATVSQLTETIVDLEKSILELDAVRQSRDTHIQLLTERLATTTEDFALVQTKRFDLIKEVERLQEQDRQRQEELSQSRETEHATVEDYEHRLLVGEERWSDELAAATKAHEEQLLKGADDRACLIADHVKELKQLSQERVDTITRMTGMIDEKCLMLQQSKDQMVALREAHECALHDLSSQLQQDRETSTNQKNELAAEFSLYAEQHSYTDEEVTSREAALCKKLSEMSTMSAEERARLGNERDSLSDQVKRLQDANHGMKTRFESQEVKLRDAVKSQLEANRKLVELNQAIKNQLAKKEAHVMQLENAATRLDSRIRMFERERTHYSADDSGKRDPDESGKSYSSQLNSHMTQIMEELAALRNENKSLQEQLARRFDEHNSSRDDNAHQSTKTYLLEKIRQLELANAQERDKKREMLMINAKLIQDHTQIQVKNASDSKEVQLLKEKVNTWMLRDERRKKEHEAFSQRVRDLESENSRLRESRMQIATVERLPDLRSSSSQEPIAQLNSMASSENQENIPPTEDLPSPTVLQRKRKIDAIDEHEDVPQSDDDPHQGNHHSDTTLHENVEKPADAVEHAPTAASPIAVPRAKRRMSQFFSNRRDSVATATTQQDDEKPSECQQQ